MLVEPTRHCPMIEALRQQGERGVWLLLLRDLARLGGAGTQLERHSERPWSSPTFHGTRHRFRLAFEGAEAVAGGEALVAALPDHEFSIGGRLVADARIASIEHNVGDGSALEVELELLVLDDA